MIARRDAYISSSCALTSPPRRSLMRDRQTMTYLNNYKDPSLVGLTTPPEEHDINFEGGQVKALQGKGVEVRPFIVSSSSRASALAMKLTTCTALDIRSSIFGRLEGR